MCGNGRSCRNKGITTTPNTLNKAFGTILFWLSCKILTFPPPESIVKSIVWKIMGGWIGDQCPRDCRRLVKANPLLSVHSPHPAPLSESDFKSHKPRTRARTAVYKCTVEICSSPSNGHQCLNAQLFPYCAAPSPHFLKLRSVSFGNTKCNIHSQITNDEQNL